MLSNCSLKNLIYSTENIDILWYFYSERKINFVFTKIYLKSCAWLQHRMYVLCDGLMMSRPI